MTAASAPQVNPTPLEEVADTCAPPKDDVNRIALLLMRAWAKADPGSNIAQFPTSYVATFADMARAVVADRAELTDLTLHAARQLHRTADMLEHLVMDTPEDQTLNDQVVATHRSAAAAIATALAVPDDRPTRR